MCQFKGGVVLAFFDEEDGFSADTDFSSEVILGEVVACTELFDAGLQNYPFRDRTMYEITNTKPEIITTAPAR